jgi:hypothetical protein
MSFNDGFDFNGALLNNIGFGTDHQEARTEPLTSPGKSTVWHESCIGLEGVLLTLPDPRTPS